MYKMVVSSQARAVCDCDSDPDTDTGRKGRNNRTDLGIGIGIAIAIGHCSHRYLSVSESPRALGCDLSRTMLQ